MGVKKGLSYSLVISALSVIVSIWVPIVPCKIPSRIPTKSFDWSFCSLNPELYLGNGTEKFFGYTTSISEAFLVLIMATFLVVFILSKFIHLLTMKGGN